MCLKARFVVDCITKLRHDVYSSFRFGVGPLLHLGCLLTMHRELNLYNFVVD